MRIKSRGIVRQSSTGREKRNNKSTYERCKRAKNPPRGAIPPLGADFAYGEELYFGTPEGGLMKFYTDEGSTSSYNDNGEGYEWRWEFPEYVGERFYRNKAVKYVALRAKAYVHSSVILEIKLWGEWYTLIADSASFGYLDLNDIDLNNLSLSTDATAKKVTSKYSARRAEKFAFRIRGGGEEGNNQPFGLYSFAFEVSESGYNKE